MSRFRGQLEAILCSFCFGGAPIFAKKGFMSGLHPFSGVAIAIATALVVTIAFVFLLGQGKKLMSMRGYGLFFATLGGISNTIATLSYFWAVSIGQVSLVVPISCIYPLFTMLGAYFFLKESEVMDIWTVIGTFLIITGVVLTV